MAVVLSFSEHRSFRPRAGRDARPAEGRLIAMRNVDLDTVLEAMRVLRQTERSGGLDPFNAAEPAATPPADPPAARA